MPFSGVQTCADRKSTRLNSSHTIISYAVFCLKKKSRHRRSLVRGCPTRACDDLTLTPACRLCPRPRGGPRSPRASIFLRTAFSAFFFNDTAPTEIYPLSLHGGLRI